MVSLNLEERRHQKEADKAFDKEMKAERLQLEKSNFAFKEVRLAPPPPPRVKAEKKPDDDPDALDDAADDEQAESYARLDIDLREALRVLSDSMQLSKDPTKWKFSYAPLSVQASQAGSLTN